MLWVRCAFGNVFYISDHLNHLMLWKWVADVCHQEFELDRIDRAASILVQRSECQSYLLIVSIIIFLTISS